MTNPTPQEQAEKLLPSNARTSVNEDWAAAKYRPAVIATLSAKDAEINRLRKALTIARDTFKHYGDLHAAKPDMEKAKRNYDMAEMIDVALGEAP